MTAALAQRGFARIEHWAAWTVMAASLTELRSRLLLPPDSPAAQAAAAWALRRRLLERGRMRAAADWLERQPQLGQTVFTRGQPSGTPAGRAGDITDLLRACPAALQVPPAQEADSHPGLPRLWTTSGAIRLMRQRLAERGGATPLSDFLPPLADTGPHRPRAAVASTLLAGLELARERAVSLAQEALWTAIQVQNRYCLLTRSAS